MKNLFFLLMAACFLPNYLVAQIDSTLLQYIEDQDVEKVDSLLQTGVDLEAVDENGANALMWACFHADTSIVQLLFDKGATMPQVGGGIYYEKESFLYTPIKGWYGDVVAIAAGEGKVDLLKYLLDEKKMEVDQQSLHLTNDTFSLWTPLMHAAQNEEGTTMQVLLEQVSDLTIKNKLGQIASEIPEDSVLQQVLVQKEEQLLVSYIGLCSDRDKTITFYEKGKYAEAIKTCESALQSIEMMYGRRHPMYGIGLNDIAKLYEEMGNYDQALPMFVEALDHIEKYFGRYHVIHRRILNNLGWLHTQMGNYDQALTMFTEVLEDTEKYFSTEQLDYVISLTNLAFLYKTMGNYEEAIFLYVDALEIVEKNYGKQSTDYGSIVNNLAQVYNSIGEYDKSFPLVLEALEITERALGKDHIKYAFGLNTLATLQVAMGNYEKALPLYVEALENMKANLGEEHVNCGTLSNNISTVYAEMGEYEKALPLALEVLKNIENNFGKQHLQYGIFLNNLSILYTDMGNYEKALPLAVEALANTKLNLGDQHEDYGMRLNNLGFLYRKTGNYEKALSLGLEALENTEKSLGKQHGDYGKCLNNLAQVHNAMGDYNEALLLHLENLERTGINLGKQHMDYGVVLKNLTNLYAKIGRYKKALPLAIEALANTENNLGKYHTDYGDRLEDLAKLYTNLGQSEKALPLLRALTENINFNIKDRLPYLPIQLQLSWKKQFEQQKAQINSFFLDRPFPVDLYSFNTQFKGLTISNLNNIVHNDTTYADWLALKKKIGREVLKTKDKRNKNLPAWEAEALESGAIVMSNRITKDNVVIVDSLKATLNADEIVIDISHFTYYNPERTDSVYYVAYIVDPLQEAIQQVYLCEETELASFLKRTDSQRMKYVADLNNSQRRIAKNRKDEVLGVVGVVLPDKRKLFELIWEPLLPYLKNKKRVYFSPSGLLHKINLNAVEVDTDTYLMDEIEISTYTNMSSKLSGGRDIEEQSYLLVGGIEYDVRSQLVAEVSTNSKPWRSIADKWPFLKWTEKEVDSIAASFKRTLTWKGEKLMKTLATEEAIKKWLTQTMSPTVVHIATHGFSFPDSQRDTVAQKTVFTSSKNPMIRSGLILAGANEAWQGKPVATGAEDGILTAYEIQNLNLRNTELVVLSACETGLGDIQGSEGVFGLQRAFKMAGAKHIIMSLWQVPDKETSVFMTAFYKYWLSDQMSIRAAFRATQKEMKKKYNNPLQWAGFVLIE